MSYVLLAQSSSRLEPLNVTNSSGFPLPKGLPPFVIEPPSYSDTADALGIPKTSALHAPNEAIEDGLIEYRVAQLGPDAT